MKFISRKNLTKRRDISLSTQKRIEKDPRHPVPVQMSPGRVNFVEAEADKYDEMLAAERRVGKVNAG